MDFESKSKTWEEKHSAWVKIVDDRAAAIIVEANRRYEMANPRSQRGKGTPTDAEIDRTLHIVDLEMGGARQLAEKEYSFSLGKKPIAPTRPWDIVGKTYLFRPWAYWILGCFAAPLVILLATRWIAAGFKN